MQMNKNKVKNQKCNDIARSKQRRCRGYREASKHYLRANYCMRSILSNDKKQNMSVP